MKFSSYALICGSLGISTLVLEIIFLELMKFQFCTSNDISTQYAQEQIDAVGETIAQSGDCINPIYTYAGEAE